MIEFKNLKISQDDETLTINASVTDSVYYQDVYIDSIIIDTLDTFIGSGPSSNPVYQKTFSSSIKQVNYTLDRRDLLTGIKNNVLFVYILTKGTPTASTPCGLDNLTTLGLVYNTYPFYQRIRLFLKLIRKNCGNQCDIPQDFINAYLQMKGIEFAARTGDYPEAIALWKQIQMTNNNTLRNCNCNGTYY